MPTPTSPTVDVIVPMYQAEATVGETLESLGRQTLRAWRAIVVDDGSTDGGPALVARLGEADPRVTLVRQENKGLSGARNRGLDEAMAPYVHFLDADDWLEPRALELLVEGAESSGLGASCCGFEYRGAGGERIGRESIVGVGVVGLAELIAWNRFVPHSQLLAARHLDGVRFAPNRALCEDHELWLRLAERGVRWRSVERVLAGYRVRPGSLSKNHERMAEATDALLRACAGRLERRGDERLAIGARASARGAWFNYATRAAIAGGDPEDEPPADEAPEDARRMVLERAYGPLTPEEAAGSAVFAVQLTHAAAPEAESPRAVEWLPRLMAWWTWIEREGLAEGGSSDDGFADRALRNFAARSLHPRRVAASILEEIPRGASIAVEGAGRSARVLAREAAAGGVRVFMLATRAELEAAPLHGVPRTCVHVDPGEPPPESAVRVRFEGPEGRRPGADVFWGEHRGRLAEAHERRLREILAGVSRAGA